MGFERSRGFFRSGAQSGSIPSVDTDADEFVRLMVIPKRFVSRPTTTKHPFFRTLSNTQPGQTVKLKANGPFR